MKKIELNAPLRFVLIVLIWLLTFTVVNLTGTLNNGGVGLIGTLVLYAGTLFLAFCYFNDCALKRAARSSLIVMVIVAVAYMFVQCYGYALDAFQITNNDAHKINTALNGIFMIGRNVTLGICLILTLVNASKDSDSECSCKKEAPKAEAKEEAKEEKEDKE